MVAFHYKNNKIRELYGQFFNRNNEYTLLVNNIGLNKGIKEKDLFRVFGTYYRVIKVGEPKNEKIELKLEKLAFEKFSRGIA